MANQIRFKRASGSDPSASDLAIGEPGLRTDTAELFFKKDDGTIAKVSGGGGGPDFKYLDLRNAANNGAASYPGNDFTLVNAGTTNAVTPAAANTLLVSVSGVIQKPNAGTSTSGITGFIVDGSRLKTATNLPAAPDFIIYQESGGIGEPSDNTVSTDKIIDDAVTYSKIQNVSATNRILGRDSSGAGVIEEITPANLRTMINVEDGATADQSNSEIKTAYEANSNTNAFTDALLSKLNGIAASATNVTNNNQITNGAGYITATLTNEQVQDIVGGMLSGNTESGITVTYQDSDGTIDFSVASQTDNNFTTTLKNKLDGIAASATNVTNNNQLTNGAGYLTSSSTLSSSNLSGALPAIDGSNLTGIAAFPSGTRMLFQQTSAPTGWTKDTSDTNNRALRVVSGSAGSGGSVAFTTAFSSQGVSGSVANATAGGSIGNTSAGGTVGNHTLSTSQIPSHNHGMQQKCIGAGCGPNIPQTGAVGTFGCNNNSTSISTFNTGGGGSHNHSFSGSSHNHSFSGSAHNHSFSGTAINLAVQYLDVIIASKN